MVPAVSWAATAGASNAVDFPFLREQVTTCTEETVASGIVIQYDVPVPPMGTLVMLGGVAAYFVLAYVLTGTFGRTYHKYAAILKSPSKGDPARYLHAQRLQRQAEGDAPSD